MYLRNQMKMQFAFYVYIFKRIQICVTCELLLPNKCPYYMWLLQCVYDCFNSLNSIYFSHTQDSKY